MSARSNGLDERSRRNTTVVIAEVVTFSLGMAFFDSASVIPGFITALTGSPVLLGLAPTIFQLGLGLPQLAAAAFLHARPRKMPFLIGASIVRNLPFFVLAGATWARPSPPILLATFFIAYLVFALGMGLESVAWMDIFAKVFTDRDRIRVLAVARTVAGPLAIVAGLVIARVLSVPGRFPRDFAVLFFVAGCFMTLAMLTFTRVREPVEGHPAPRAGAGNVFARGRDAWRADPNFRRFIGARVAYSAVFVATPFFFRFARDVVGVEEAAIGYFIAASMAGQILANMVWGYVGARFGSKRVVQAVLALGVTLPVYVLLTPHLPRGAFLAVYAVTGAIVAGEMLGWMNLLLAIVPASSRPLYVSLQGLLLIPANLLPLLAGAALQILPYRQFFIGIALCFGVSLWLVGRVDQQPASATPVVTGT